MKATSGQLPRGDGWAYEIKWDGMRAVVTVDDEAVRAYSTRGNEVSASFPELQQLIGTFGTAVVLDGELVALRDGEPSFAAMQRRMHLTDPGEVRRRAADVPVVFVIFDILRIGENETLSLPYEQRRQLLENLVEPGPTWRLTEVHRGDGEALLDVVVDRRLEGLVAKRLDSRYESGRRSSNWVKVKPRRRQEMVVGGWVSGEDNRIDVLSSLMVGHRDDAGLRFAGTVGSGLTDGESRRLRSLLDEHVVDRSPFADPVPRFPRRRSTFVEPVIVVEVAFSEWTDDGSLRHPVYLGQRSDVDPARVVREP